MIHSKRVPQCVVLSGAILCAACASAGADEAPFDPVADQPPLVPVAPPPGASPVDPRAPASAPPPSGVARPIYGLIAVREDAQSRVASVTANAGFATAYQLDVEAEPDDVLRIFGQLEVTNDFAQPVNATLRARVDGKAVGSSASENAVVTASHHLPLWVDAVETSTTRGKRTITLEIAAARSGASPAIAVENGYGHLVVEHYRRFPDRAALESTNARGVAIARSDRTARASTFGGTFATRALPFAATVDVRSGDVVRLLGTSTSRTPVGEMHGLGVFYGATLVGPFASKNGVSESPEIPLTVDATDRPTTDAPRTYSVSMHGVFNRGGGVAAGGGGLDVLVFRDAKLGPARFPGAFAYAQVPGGTVTANAGAREVARVPLGTLPQGTPTRVAVHMTLAPSPAVAVGIVCTLQVSVGVDPARALAPLATQYVTPSMASVALVARAVVVTPKSGLATVHATAACAREGSSPQLLLSPVTVLAEPLVADL